MRLVFPFVLWIVSIRGNIKGRIMVIDPTICITCGACLPECPIGAIVESEDMAPEWQKSMRVWPSVQGQSKG